MKNRFVPTALVLSLITVLSASAFAFGGGDKLPRPDHKAFHAAVLSGALTDAELATLRVLILSANADPKDRLAALDAGADAYLSKPFSPVELDRQVKALLSKT